MKKIMLIMVTLFITITATKAMTYAQAREQALFLTDKMAYELNLTQEQYEAAYEINLDYLMAITGTNDVYAMPWRQRNIDLSYILYDWQYAAYEAASYFFRPVFWNAGYWHFGIYSHYPHRTYYYFARPAAYNVYRGGHSWRRNSGRSWYVNHTTHYRPAIGTNHRHTGLRDTHHNSANRHNERNNSFRNGTHTNSHMNNSGNYRNNSRSWNSNDNRNNRNSENRNFNRNWNNNNNNNSNGINRHQERNTFSGPTGNYRSSTRETTGRPNIGSSSHTGMGSTSHSSMSSHSSGAPRSGMSGHSGGATRSGSVTRSSGGGGSHGGGRR